MITKLFMIIFMLLLFSKFCGAKKPFSALMFQAHITASEYGETNNKTEEAFKFLKPNLYLQFRVALPL